MPLQVGGGLTKKGGIVSSPAKQCVAPATKKIAHATRNMVVIDRQAKAMSLAIHLDFRLFADGANAILREEFAVVLVTTRAEGVKPSPLLLAILALFADALVSLVALQSVLGQHKVRLALAAPLQENAIPKKRPAWPIILLNHDRPFHNKGILW